MTLILALVGRDNAVLAADAKQRKGDGDGFYASAVEKLKIVNGGNWILGVALAQIGLDLAGYVEENSESFNANIHLGIHSYVKRMRELYREHGHSAPTSLLVAGCGKDDVAVYGFNLEGGDDGTVVSEGATKVLNQSAMGAAHHGAMYLSHALHRMDTSLVQRISIAHFSVSEACKQDVRVGPPVEIGLVRVGKRPQILGPKQLENVQSQSAKIADEIRDMVMSSNPAIDDLLE